jgi:hypothetical protein
VQGINPIVFDRPQLQSSSTGDEASSTNTTSHDGH